MAGYVIHDENNIKGFFDEYRFLSNFYAAPVWYEGILYPSTENAYQAAKTIHMSVRKGFLSLSCGQAKHKGQEIEIREDWDKIKFDVMFAVVFDKFFRHDDLREKLVSTESKYLEEANHWNDRFWGRCDGVGENNLGKILMEVRKIIRMNPHRRMGFII